MKFTRWRQLALRDMQMMTSTVRYRLLVLLLLPVLLTLASLVFITIYWNVTYTGSQLFMKVRSDLSVAQGVLKNQRLNRQDFLKQLRHSWEFQRILASGEPAELTHYLSEQQQHFGLSFLRYISPEQLQLDDDLRALMSSPTHGGLQVLSAAQMNQLDPLLAERAEMAVEATLMSGPARRKVETRGLFSRFLVPVLDPHNVLHGYLDGGVLLNRDTQYVDQVRDLVYADDALPYDVLGTTTLMLDDLRIATNVPDRANGARVIGTLVSEQVRKKVLLQGEVWVDRAFVYDDWYVSAYAPLNDISGKRIGMLYTGFSEETFIGNYLRNIYELGSMLLVVLVLSGWAVYRGAAGLLRPIGRISKVVQQVQAGQDRRIGDLGLSHSNELSQLAKQFDVMLDQLQERSRQIQAANDQLEQKVVERTQTLQARTLELKQNIELLNATREQMVTNEKLVALGEMTAGIAHEINNPTAVILGNIELIKWELGDSAATVEEEIELILQQVQRIKAIIQSLLQYARPGQMDAPISLQPINPIIDEMLVLVRHSLRKQSVEVLLDLQAQQSAQVNRQQLLQVLINLVVNAAHAMDGDGEVRVSSEDWLDGSGQPQGVIIQVADDGCGIPTELQSRIFDPFFTTRKQGTGLGLSLSYGIVRRFGGHFEVESAPNQGSVFTLKLPLAAPLNDGNEMTLS
ncbi:sensor histidine kinase [Ferrimonas senticii]|uniref:sensor histidine kinase n=1 Tax=Ferrimonas senticii TaxID=394566 RepID=UPI00042306C5|nr:HAMP domain-containing sensor histidine kinase [Ferrimonas senticii]